MSFDSADGPFGSNLKKEHYTSNHEVRIIQLSNIGEFGWREDNKKYTTFSHLENIRRSEAFAGDIIIAKMMPAGRAIICPTNEKKYVLSSDAVRFSFSQILNRSYIYFAINSPIFLDQVYSEVHGITRVRTSLTKLRSYLLPVPPLNEQERIVKEINHLVRLTFEFELKQNALNELNNTIRASLKKSILQEAIQGRLVAQSETDEPASAILEKIRAEKQCLVKKGKLKKSALEDSIIFKGDDNKYWEKRGKEIVCIDDEIPFDIPDSWVWTRLSHVANIYTGNSVSETEKKLKFTNVEGRYYIGTKDVGFDNEVIYDNGIAIPKQYEYGFKIAHKYSILMCIEGGSAGRKIAILNQDVCFGNKLCCFSPFVEIEKYIYYYLQSPTFIDTFNGNKTGIIGGVSIAKVKDILIPLPPQQEINKIVAKIDEFVASIMSI